MNVAPRRGERSAVLVAFTRACGGQVQPERGVHPVGYGGRTPQADGCPDVLRYGRESMNRRDFLVDGAIALVAFALSAAIIVAAGADPEIRDPDALAFALVVAHSAG